MSLVFSDVDGKSGIIQLIEDNLNFPDAHISGNPARFKRFTRDVNLALDRALHLIFQVGGTWHFDDTNHSDWPIITTNLVSGQRDYPFVTDESGNLILEIYKVMVADSSGTFFEMTPVDTPRSGSSNFWDGLETTGMPNSYGKLGNGFFLDPPSDYNRSGGVKVYINREASYFTTAHTDRKAGFSGLYHEYLALRPAYQYAYRNKLANASELEAEMLKFEAAIMDYYKSREKDVQKTLMGASNNSH